MSIAQQRGIGDVVRCAFVFQTRWVAARRAIKVLSDLSIVFLLQSIDIQVLSDLARFGRCAAFAWRGAIILFILRILAILLQTQKRAADKPPRDRQMHREKAPRSFMSIDAQQEYGEKVWKPLMSIERRSNKEKRSVGP